MLIKGISERNVRKVRIYRWYLTVGFVLFLVRSIYGLMMIPNEAVLDMKRQKIYGTIIASEIFGIIFGTLITLYFIYVIYSIETLYLEQPLPVTQPGVTYTMYPQQQAQVIVAQPYYAPPSQQDYKHASAPYPTNPSPYPQNPTSYPTNPTYYPPNNSFPVKQ